MKKCKVEGCNTTGIGKNKDNLNLGYCRLHYTRFKKYGDHNFTLTQRNNIGCKIDGCDGKHLAKGYCIFHYSRMKYTGDVNTELTKNTKSGGTKHKEYAIHNNIKQRCNNKNNPAYAYYGWRDGIEYDFISSILWVRTDYGIHGVDSIKRLNECMAEINDLSNLKLIDRSYRTEF